MSPAHFQLDPGLYIIYNRVLSPNGQRLVMTFNGKDQPTTVTPIDPSSPKQQWVIENYKYDEERATSLQHVRPQTAQELESGWGEAIFATERKNQVWGITKDGSAYTIRDGGKSITWGVQTAAQSTPVVPMKDATGEKQRWVFHKVNTPLPH